LTQPKNIVDIEMKIGYAGHVFNQENKMKQLFLTIVILAVSIAASGIELIGQEPVCNTLVKFELECPSSNCQDSETNCPAPNDSKELYIECEATKYYICGGYDSNSHCLETPNAIVCIRRYECTLIGSSSCPSLAPVNCGTRSTAQAAPCDE